MRVIGIDAGVGETLQVAITQQRRYTFAETAGVRFSCDNWCVDKLFITYSSKLSIDGITDQFSQV
jgi:hypothetical protein